MFTKIQNLHESIKFLTKRYKHTIYALSSGYGKCGVAVIRVSGHDSKLVLTSITNQTGPLKPRFAALKSIRHPTTREILDKGLVLWFPGPNSFTGEDSLELHVHGSIAVVSAILKALGTFPNVRLADPGEFTRRAFYNGKLDLTEVEGLSDLLQAETEVQRKQAFLQSQGVLSKKYNKWREILLKNIAHVEAFIDFDETDTLEEDLLDKVKQDIINLREEIFNHLKGCVRGQRLRNGVKTVIIGRPNVGKSSLMNAFCQRPVAIVTPIEGTTRDALEVALDVGGYPLVLIDTAGLRRDVTDIVEEEGIRRAKECYSSCDLVIFMIDGPKYLFWKSKNLKPLSCYIKEEFSYLLDQEVSEKSVIIVLNKLDACKPELIENDIGACLVSCKTMEGFERLGEVLRIKLKELCGEPSEEHPCINQERHRQLLSDCLRKIDQFLTGIEHKSDVVCLAENLRSSLKHLGKLTGAVSTEELLDVIFKDFCIGK